MRFAPSSWVQVPEFIVITEVVDHHVRTVKIFNPMFRYDRYDEYIDQEFKKTDDNA